MASISKLTVGQTLFSLSRQKMGNTNVSRTACHLVVVKAIAEDLSFIEASWNGNPSRRYYPREVAKLKIKKPTPKREVFGMPSY
jgi:hypothetical protein